MDASERIPSVSTESLTEWYGTALGRYLLERELRYFDDTIADIFGYHALQIGLPSAQFLRSSRITAKFTLDPEEPAQLAADPHWLPFAENTFDLVLLPHSLEFSDQPHQILREVYRCLRPEGQVVVAGFNPFSLYGFKRYFGREQTPPWTGSYISLYRLKDWLALLGFEVAGGRLDCYAPPFRQVKWLQRFAFVEQAGDRWWPIGGGVYFLRATKRVAGMRLILPAWHHSTRKRKELAAAARRVKELATARRRMRELAAAPHRVRELATTPRRVEETVE
jgi:SAM-dependent methyltransferase